MHLICFKCCIAPSHPDSAFNLNCQRIKRRSFRVLDRIIAVIAALGRYHCFFDGVIVREVDQIPEIRHATVTNPRVQARGDLEKVEVTEISYCVDCRRECFGGGSPDLGRFSPAQSPIPVVRNPDFRRWQQTGSTRNKMIQSNRIKYEHIGITIWSTLLPKIYFEES